MKVKAKRKGTEEKYIIEANKIMETDKSIKIYYGDNEKEVFRKDSEWDTEYVDVDGERIFP